VVLIASESRAATMREVVVAALKPHCADGDRCTISGPNLAIGGRRAHALTLALHELATNAQKYGALSVQEGWVEVVWTCDDNQLDFIWREHQGPSVSAPSRTGFGSKLITHNLQGTFDGKVELTFDPAGVECRLVAGVLE
jgi:two-component sensor histidine kinase